MANIGTYFKVVDNTGAENLLCIGNLTRKSKKIMLGDIIVGVIKSAKPNSLKKPSEIVRAIVIRTKNVYTQIDGTSIKFFDNAVVLVDFKLNLLGSRLHGSIYSNSKLNKYTKLISMSKEFFII